MLEREPSPTGYHNRGFGFVGFYNHACADQARRRLDNSYMCVPLGAVVVGEGIQWNMHAGSGGLHSNAPMPPCDSAFGPLAIAPQLPHNCPATAPQLPRSFGQRHVTVTWAEPKKGDEVEKEKVRGTTAGHRPSFERGSRSARLPLSCSPCL